MNNERTTSFFGGLLPRVRVPKRRTTEAQRARRRGATSASVPSVPLWFKRLDKNVVLLGDLRKSGAAVRPTYIYSVGFGLVGSGYSRGTASGLVNSGEAPFFAQRPLGGPQSDDQADDQPGVPSGVAKLPFFLQFNIQVAASLANLVQQGW